MVRLQTGYTLLSSKCFLSILTLNVGAAGVQSVWIWLGNQRVAGSILAWTILPSVDW